MKKKEPEKIGNVLDLFLRERGYATICKEYDAVSRWKQIAGEKIANETECTGIENGKLFVKVSSASWRQELVYMKEHLIKSINRETGCNTILDIIFY